MPIDPTTVTTSTAYTPGIYSGQTVSTAKQSLDGETFLNLLVAQLRYQDPSSPMDTTEMMTQTTQLATMEQLTTLTSTMTESFALQMRQTAAAFVGREVTYLDAEGEPASGVVTSTSFALGVPTVRVGGVDVTLDAVLGLTAAAADSGIPDPETTDPETPTDPATT